MASNGVDRAASGSRSTNPDVITLDIEMPEMDGLEMLRRVRREYPAIRVVMFSTLTERGAAATLEALTLGADDYVTKASNAGSLDVSLEQFAPGVDPENQTVLFVSGQADPHRAGSGNGAGLSGRARRRARSELPFRRVVRPRSARCSAISRRIFPCPIFIVQHMPPLFTRLLAERLQRDEPSCVLWKLQRESVPQAGTFTSRRATST